MAVTPLAVLAASPAQAAEPVVINLLGFNDFHGRIDSNTTKFATTIEQLRTGGTGTPVTDDHTLVVSSGDNFGASAFASATSTPPEQPTVNVLNALALSGAAVGNHEFDRGYDFLNDQVIGGTDYTPADFPYLAANVYDKATHEPAPGGLEEYATFDIGGITVGIVGAVTQETGSLVSPGGITNIEFGDPVDAVNRVTAELTDGDATNGEADVVIASYHEGVNVDQTQAPTIDDALALGGAFKHIVEDTSADVDAIFTGHTHRKYAYDAPVPGDPSRTRPVIQAGNYGEAIGQVELSYDAASDTATTLVNKVVPRAAAADTTFPRVQSVKTIVDAALADANARGSVPVGELTADITRAFDGIDPTTQKPIEDRLSESTIGDLVADALRSYLSSYGADIGVVNPEHCGTTSSTPASRAATPTTTG